MSQPDCSHVAQAGLNLSCETKDDLQLLILLCQPFKCRDCRYVPSQPELWFERLLLMGASSTHSAIMKWPAGFCRVQNSPVSHVDINGVHQNG